MGQSQIFFSKGSEPDMLLEHLLLHWSFDPLQSHPNCKSNENLQAINIFRTPEHFKIRLLMLHWLFKEQKDRNSHLKRQIKSRNYAWQTEDGEAEKVDTMGYFFFCYPFSQQWSMEWENCWQNFNLLPNTHMLQIKMKTLPDIMLLFEISIKSQLLSLRQPTWKNNSNDLLL